MAARFRIEKNRLTADNIEEGRGHSIRFIHAPLQLRDESIGLLNAYPNLIVDNAVAGDLPRL